MTDDETAPVEVEHFTVYAYGLVYASVCTTLTDDEATARLNAELPTGISSRWAIAVEAFADATPNPSPCANVEGARHILFNCWFPGADELRA